MDAPLLKKRQLILLTAKEGVTADIRDCQGKIHALENELALKTSIHGDYEGKEKTLQLLESRKKTLADWQEILDQITEWQNELNA